MLRSTWSPNLFPVLLDPGRGMSAPPERLHRLLMVFLTRTERVFLVLTATLVKLLSLYLYYNRAVALISGLPSVAGLAYTCRAYFWEWLLL